MAIKLTAGTDSYFNLDKGNGVIIPLQRGMYEIQPLQNGTVVQILRVGENNTSKLVEAPLSSFVNNLNAPFIDFQAFVDYLKPFFFRSVTGGGGAGVTSFEGRTGAVVSASGDYTTDEVTEVIDKKYVTNAEKTKINTTLHNFSYNQSNLVQTTNSTTGVTYLTLIKNGTFPITKGFLVTGFVSVTHNSTNSYAFLRLKDFGVTIGAGQYLVEPKDNGDRVFVPINFVIFPQVANQIQLQLDFGTTNAGDTTTINAAFLSLQELP